MSEEPGRGEMQAEQKTGDGVLAQRLVRKTAKARPRPRSWPGRVVALARSRSYLGFLHAKAIVLGGILVRLREV